MAWDHDIDLSTKQFTNRLIIQRALARGWRIRDFPSNPAIYLLYLPNRDQPLKIFSASPPQISLPAYKIAKDKYITNQSLADHNLPVPKEMLVSIDEATTDNQQLLDFIKACGTVVVKPIDASHGKGITMGVMNIEMLNKAATQALVSSDKTRVLVQQQLSGRDIRVVCIDYKFADAITRVPASVVGDGKHSIAELIKIANRHPERGEKYKNRLSLIPIDQAWAFLGKQNVKRLPTAGETVQVIGVSNTGMGGERRNIKNTIPDWLKKLAEQVTVVLDLPVCGVDFIVARLPQPSDKPEDLKAVVIEVNSCPSLMMYEDLNSPEQIALVDDYLDYVAKA